MANADADHCGTCRHHGGGEAPWCSVRRIAIQNPASTCCANLYGDDKAPIGPLFALHDDHERIPHYGTGVPRSIVASRCEVCGAGSVVGAGVGLSDTRLGELQFCSPRHYVRWWKEIHPGETLKWDCDAAPELTHEELAFAATKAKLELATACLDVGDWSGAREALAEVLAEGGPAHRDQARAMLEQLSARKT